MRTTRQRFVTGTIVVLAVLCSAAWTVPAKGSRTDRALMKAGVLNAKDLPTRWKSRTVTLGATNTLQGVGGCEEQSAALDLDQRRAPSRGFYDPVNPPGGITPQASNVARVFKNAALADQFLSAYKAPSAAACLHQVNENEFKRRNPSAEITVTDFTPVTGLDGIGDDSVGYAAVINAFTSEQSTLSGALDLIYVRAGRVVLGFKLSLETQDNSQLTDIISHPVGRVAKVQQ